MAILPRQDIEVDVADWDDVGAYARRLAGDEVYSGGPYILILRSDIFASVSEIAVKACTITHWCGTTSASRKLKKARSAPEISAPRLEEAKKEPLVRDVMKTWEEAAGGKTGDEAAAPMREALRKLRSRPRKKGRTAPRRLGGGA
jgi:hypothetical protein